MKRLASILLLSVCQLAIAQQCLIPTEVLKYKLSWSLPLGLWGGYAGKAYFSYQPQAEGGFLLRFHVVCPDSVKLIDAVDNAEIVSIDQAGRIQEIHYASPDSPNRSLKTSYADSCVSYYLENNLVNTIRLEGKLSDDIFSAIFLRKWPKGKQYFELSIIGRNSEGTGIAWKKAWVTVGKETLSIQNENRECWKLEVVMDPNDILIFNGGVKFGRKTTLWITDQLIPVKLETKIKLLGIINIKAELSSLFPRDD